MEHHACANLEHLFSYSRHFSANAQRAHGNYFRLSEKHGQELVWTLTGIVQTIGSGNGTPSRMDASMLVVIQVVVVLESQPRYIYSRIE